MITVGMNYRVLPGKDEVFIKVFEKVLKVMGEMPGHVETHLYRDVFSPQEYLIISEWDDEDAFNAFIQSDRFRNVADWGKEHVLAGRPHHEIYGAKESAASGPGAQS